MQSWMIGMVLGLVLTGYAPALPSMSLVIPVVLSVTGLALWACLHWPSRSLRRVLLKALLGLSWGVLSGVSHGYFLLDYRLPTHCVGQSLEVEGQVVSLPSQRAVPGIGIRQTFRFRVNSIEPAECAAPRHVLLNYYGEERLVPGDFWRFPVRLKPPWGLSNPGGYNGQAWLAQAGIHATGSVRLSSPHKYLGPGISGMHHRLRQRISSRIGELGLKPDIAAVLRAVTVADKSAINEQLWGLFQQFGINHLLVISGLHVGLVAGMGYLFGAALARLFVSSRYSGASIPGLCALLAAFLFAALAGFSLPAVRALCMLACVLTAVWTGRLTIAWSHLLLAALVVLLLNPLAAIGSGFWLSFGSVAGLLWYLWWRRYVGKGRVLVGTHAYMALLMLPFGALFFQGASLVGALGNFIMIPLVGWIIVPAALSASASYLLGLPFDTVLWRCAAWPLEQILPLAAMLAERGGNWIYLSRNTALPAMVLALCGIGLLVVPAAGWFRILSVLLLLPVLLPERPNGQTSLQKTEVTVFDVGQGTAVLIRAGSQALLYDTGGGQREGPNIAMRVILPLLQREGLSALDTLIVSHPDLDHSAGQDAVIATVNVKRLRYGGDPVQTLPGRPCVAGEAWRWPGGQIFQFLSPAVAVPPKRNNASCVLMVRVGRSRLLLPGDIERVQERALVEYWGRGLDADWLLAGHHGSQTSSSWPWLKFSSPSTVVVSSGYANRFGHPHEDIVVRYRALDMQVIETWRAGALRLEFSPLQSPAITLWRDKKRRYWL